MKPWVRWIPLVVLIALAAIQLFPIDRTNPAVEREIPAPPEVHTVLRRACYDCHSNETVWPWYARVAPVSWMLQHDVGEGRRKANFSTWNRYDAVRQKKLIREIWKEVARKDMPPWAYVAVHPPAKLSERDREVLRVWTAASAGPEPASRPPRS